MSRRHSTPSLIKISIVLTAVLLLVAAAARAQTGRVAESASHRFTEYADGVWHAVGSGSVHVMSNAMVLVGEFDTLVVDSHVTPAAARSLIESLAVITDKPVRYLVNSHYHFDHAHGNQAFPREVEIIGHSYTRQKLNGELGNVLEEATFKSFSDGVPATVVQMESQIAAETDPSRRAVLEERTRVQRDYMNAIPEVRPTPPNITLETRMTLFQVVSRGSREIQLLHLGRAHTGGDVVIFLPQERIVFTGDMLLPALSYMGDGFVNEWPDSLAGLDNLDFLWVFPGHGQPFSDRAVIDNFQAYLSDLWQKTGDLKRRGLSAQQAAEQIDLSNHAANYPQIRGPGADVRAINRIYQLLDE
jgi:cyclase